MRAAFSKAEIESELSSRFASAFKLREKRPAEVIPTGIPQIHSFTLDGLPRGAITLDLGDVPAKSAKRIISSWWYRFRRTLETTPTALVVIARGHLRAIVRRFGVGVKRRNLFALAAGSGPSSFICCVRSCGCSLCFSDEAPSFTSCKSFAGPQVLSRMSAAALSQPASDVCQNCRRNVLKAFCEASGWVLGR